MERAWAQLYAGARPYGVIAAVNVATMSKSDRLPGGVHLGFHHVLGAISALDMIGKGCGNGVLITCIISMFMPAFPSHVMTA